MKIILFFLFFLSFEIGIVYGDPVSAQTSFEDKIHFVDEQIMITADVSNNQDTQQNFAYITQVRNNDDVVISLSWLIGSLTPRQSFSPAQSWIPTESGIYHIEVFVWEGIDNPSALSPPLSLTVKVTERQT
ncbi:hypothetical protein [Nitrosopumilus sp.]|uniref:hypothetical protein n=1 Tax=Nitrosopumilus sp. TaxID=2024843 RepID=UPI00247E9DE7|nr:hypothetical protein [Nitrosopumilus sp.]MCV0429974.1 hypothetical protein [Nitrosopumilus sp.]